MVTDQQGRLLRQKCMENKTQEVVEEPAGMSTRSARTWEAGPLPSETKGPQAWRTRPDPSEQVWEREVVPVLCRDEAGWCRPRR